MPIFEYECPNCGIFESIQLGTDPDLKHCPTCSEKGTKQKVKKVVSAAAFHLIGSGWYKNDYKSSSNSGGGKSKAAGSTTSSEPTSSSGTASSDGGSTSSAPNKSCGGGCTCH